MTVARTDAPRRSDGLTDHKGRELVGLVILTVALLLLTSLATYHPADPSLLHETDGDQTVRNLIGPFGADLAVMPYLIAKWGRGEFSVREIVEAPNRMESVNSLHFVVIWKY